MSQNGVHERSGSLIGRAKHQSGECVHCGPATFGVRPVVYPEEYGRGDRRKEARQVDLECLEENATPHDFLGNRIKEHEKRPVSQCLPRELTDLTQAQTRTPLEGQEQRNPDDRAKQQRDRKAWRLPVERRKPHGAGGTTPVQDEVGQEMCGFTGHDLEQ